MKPRPLGKLGGSREPPKAVNSQVENVSGMVLAEPRGAQAASALAVTVSPTLAASRTGASTRSTCVSFASLLGLWVEVSTCTQPEAPSTSGGGSEQAASPGPSPQTSGTL